MMWESTKPLGHLPRVPDHLVLADGGNHAVGVNLQEFPFKYDVKQPITC